MHTLQTAECTCTHTAKSKEQTACGKLNNTHFILNPQRAKTENCANVDAPKMQCVMLKMGVAESKSGSIVTNIIAESCDVFGDKRM